jgi:hypothetical protein
VSAALVIAALCLPLTALVWRLGGLWTQGEFLAYKREKNRESAELAAKQAHEIQASLLAKHEDLHKAFNAYVEQTNHQIHVLKQGRDTIKRAG